MKNLIVMLVVFLGIYSTSYADALPSTHLWKKPVMTSVIDSVGVAIDYERKVVSIVGKELKEYSYDAYSITNLPNSYVVNMVTKDLNTRMILTIEPGKGFFYLKERESGKTIVYRLF